MDAAYRDVHWHWTPDTPPVEQIFGAILVQHTAWPNVDRALDRLRDAGALSFRAVAAMSAEKLADLVRPAGTPREKARRLKALAATIDRVAGGDLSRFLALPAAELRDALLATHGVGEETADAIALYSGGKPFFVIDAYTRRLFRRLGLGPALDSYRAWQQWFEEALSSAPRPGESPAETGDPVELYRRYHAAIVLHCKAVCLARPRCGGCPLSGRCPTGQTAG